MLISPVESTEELRIALGGAFHYQASPGGDVRGLEPVKSHPHSDLADALIYVLCEMWPQVDREARRHRHSESRTLGVGFSPSRFFPKASGAR